MKKIKALIVMVAILTSIMPNTYASNDILQIYVSSAGNDTNNGSELSPYKTIVRAAQAVEILNKNGEISNYSKVEIILSEGPYSVGKGIAFYSDNGGNENTEIVFKANNNDEVHINAAQKADNQMTVTDERINDDVRDKIKCVDVSEMNLVQGEETYTLNSKTEAPEFLVYQDDTLMTSARYPNKNGSKNTFVEINGKANETKDDTISYYIGYTDADETRIENWSNISEIYMAGFPNVEWEYSKIKIAGIDQESNKIFANEGINAASSLKNSDFWFSNIIEELDAPGEYYYDAQNKKLYYYPVSDGDLYITKSQKPLFELINAQNIRFENLIFEGTVSNAAAIYGGQNIDFYGCTFKSIADKAIYMNDNKKCTVKKCSFQDLGDGGIYIDSDRYSLESQENIIEDCDFSDYENINPVYASAVKLNGVKNTVRYCDISNTYHTAVNILGNENVLEYCKIQNVCNGTDDAGAVYAYGDSTSRGNIIQNNYFAGVGNVIPSESAKRSTYGVWAVYLDGYTSGYRVLNNIFDTVYGGVFVNNGGYNTVDSNVFNNVSLPVLSFGILQEDEYMNKPAYAESFRKRRYNKYYNSKIWNTKYPELADLRKDIVYPSEYYVNNIIKNNRYYGPLCLYTQASENAFTWKDEISVISLRGDTKYSNNEHIAETYSVSSNDFGKRR